MTNNSTNITLYGVAAVLVLCNQYDKSIGLIICLKAVK